MTSNLDAIVVFDLENCVYLAKNILLRMIHQGELDPVFYFSDGEISEPVGASIISILARLGIDSSIVVKVVSKESGHLLSTCSRLECRISKDYGYFNLPGSQAADREIRKILDHLYNTLPIDVPVILVSGDGDFIPLLDYAKSVGKEFYVFSFEESCNKFMIKNATKFIPLEDDVLFDPETIRRS